MAGAPFDDSRPGPSSKDAEEADRQKQENGGQYYPADPAGSTGFDGNENGQSH
jgi:hypothetical protein